MSKRWVALAVVGATLLGALVWRRSPVREESGAAAKPTYAAPVVDTPASVELESPSEDAEREAAPVEREPAPQKADRRAPIARPRVFLVGRVELAGQSVADASIMATVAPPDAPARTPNVRAYNVTAQSTQPRNYAFGVAGVSDERGEYRIDVSKLLRDPESSKPLTLWIRATRAEGKIDEFETTVTQTDFWSANNDPLDVRADLELLPGCRVSASVSLEDSSDKPFFARARRIDRGGRPDDELDRWISSNNGAATFSWELECGLEHELVAYAEGFTPQRLTFVPIDGLSLSRVVLSRGETIDGRIEFAGAPLVALVDAELVDPGPTSNVANVTFANRDGALMVTRVSAWSDSDGRFELNGLGRGTYRLSVRTARGGFTTPTVLGEFEAPARALRVELPCARVELLVVAGGRAAPGLLLDISERAGNVTSGGAVRTDERGIAVVWMRPEARTTVSYRPKDSSDEPAPGRGIELELDFPGVGAERRVRIDL